jgi:hypothetical protein
MGEYLSKLIEQFKSATGVNHVDINSEEFIREFSEWIIVRKKLRNHYNSFIEYMDVYPKINGKTVEVDKGIFDSIALDSNMTMITPYPDGVNKAKGDLIKATFTVYEGIPVVVKNKNGVNNLEFLDTSFINRFITQNPYDISHIKNWEQLHNKGQNITVGIFGSIYDKDISQKISELKEFKKGFKDDNFSEDYVTENDMYCYALSSSRKANTLVRTR